MADNNWSHFGKISYVKGNVAIDIDLTKYKARHVYAQQHLGLMVLESCKPFMPMNTGGLIQRSYVADGGRRVVFPGPSARYLFGGKVMVDSVTGKGPAMIHDKFGVPVGLRFRKGATLKVTDRNLNISTEFNSKAQAHWYEPAKAKDGQMWIAETRRIIYGGV